MNRLLLIFILFFSILTSNAQIKKKEMNKRFLKFYPIDFTEVFIDRPINGRIKTIEISKNDTIHFKTHFEKNRLNSVVFDNAKMSFSYRFDRLSRIDNINHDTIISKTKIYKIFPFIFAFNNGLSYTGFRLFGKTYKMKQVSGFKTFSKRKARYKNGRVHKIKNYGWQTVAQHCYFTDYQILDYPNDTTVVERNYDSNDSLASEIKFVFDKIGNILETKTLSRKRVKGWGIDITYYSYDADETYKCGYYYEFDEQKNWIVKSADVNGTLQEIETRIIKYED